LKKTGSKTRALLPRRPSDIFFKVDFVRCEREGDVRRSILGRKRDFGVIRAAYSDRKEGGLGSAERVLSSLPSHRVLAE
jgi:hypothetical protein